MLFYGVCWLIFVIQSSNKPSGSDASTLPLAAEQLDILTDNVRPGEGSGVVLELHDANGKTWVARWEEKK